MQSSCRSNQKGKTETALRFDEESRKDMQAGQLSRFSSLEKNEFRCRFRTYPIQALLARILCSYSSRGCPERRSTGNKSISSTYLLSSEPSILKPAPHNNPDTNSEPNSALSIFDAVSKRLGLKLEKGKRPLPVLVIDHIDETPTEN
jgi:uncharacterized protein (TIGR03435 family)